MEQWASPSSKRYFAIAVFCTPLTLLFIALIVPAFLPRANMAVETRSLGHVKEIGFACHTYAEDHGGKFPPNLDALFPTYLPDRAVLVSPFQPDEHVGYIYVTGHKETDPPDAVLLEDKFTPRITHHRVVGYLDGSAAVLPVP